MIKSFLTESQLAQICEVEDTTNIRIYFNHLVRFMELTHITTPMRVAAFIATIAHESGRFRYSEEIADGSAYEGREDLGNVVPGDGPRYKGRGLIQLTGRHNYETLSIDYGEDFINFPEKISLPYYAVMSACWFWNKKDLNTLADEGNFKAITRKVNGALRGWKDRLHIYTLALMILNNE